MEREIGLMTQSWNSAMREKEGLLQGLLPLLVGSEMKTFSLPKPLDDDGTDISLKDWQLGLRNSVEREPTAVYPFKPFKGSMRTRFTPIEPWLDEIIQSPSLHSSPDKFETAPTTPRTPSSGTRSNSVSPTRSDSSYRGDSSLQQLGFTTGDGHHLQNINVVSGIASPRTPGIMDNEVSLNDAKLDSFNYRARSVRGSSLRVSFVDELEGLQSPSPPLKSTATQVSKDSVGQQLHKWETCTEICPQSAPSMPKTRVQPTLHGVRSREGITSAVKPRVSPLPLPEIETVYQSHGMFASRDKESQLRHSSRQARRSLDSIGERSKYNSSSNFISSSLASPYQSRRENTSISDPSSPSSLLQCNSRRQHDEEEDEDDDEVGILCGGGLSDTKISGDFVRLVSKLCRLSVPLPEQSTSKPSQQRGSLKFARSNSIPALISWDSTQINSSMPCQDYAIIGRQNSLKLLCERCSNGPTPAYNLPKPRKIRDHEPHQHFYKPISKTLDQKLKS